MLYTYILEVGVKLGKNISTGEFEVSSSYQVQGFELIVLKRSAGSWFEHVGQRCDDVICCRLILSTCRVSDSIVQSVECWRKLHMV